MVTFTGTGRPDETATRINPVNTVSAEEAARQAMGGDYTALQALSPEDRAVAVNILAEASRQAATMQARTAGQAQVGANGYPNQSASIRPVSSGTAYGANALSAVDSGVQINAGKPEDSVLRPNIDSKYHKYEVPPLLARTPNHVPISSYAGEYGKKIEDDAFRDWMRKRAVVLGNADPTKPEDLLSNGYALWQNSGQFVATNPMLRATVTPEQWLDKQYELAGGDALYAAKVKEAEAKANPITHNRQVTTYTVNAAEAQAAIDDMSQGLLGRMASDSELKRARAAMQRLLTPTVTNTTTNATDPANIQTSSHTKAGVGPDDAEKILRMRMQRGSEGMAFNMGQMFEDALKGM